MRIRNGSERIALNDETDNNVQRMIRREQTIFGQIQQQRHQRAQHHADNRRHHNMYAVSINA